MQGKQLIELTREMVLEALDFWLREKLLRGELLFVVSDVATKTNGYPAPVETLVVTIEPPKADAIVIPDAHGERVEIIGNVVT